MTTTFGRRGASSAAPRPHPTPLAAAPPPAAADPRLAELAASVRGDDPTKSELGDYLRRRRAAIGPWRWAARGLYVAPTAASWLLGVQGVWLVPISLASLAGPMLVKRARLRWAAQIEAQARDPAEPCEP
ncbi:MAG: hypothetical protein INR64_00550 [Caulobacteraceae bacterium]|nr:hypothetical protein [Caulobacter sp.]